MHCQISTAISYYTYNVVPSQARIKKQTKLNHQNQCMAILNLSFRQGNCRNKRSLIKHSLHHVDISILCHVLPDYLQTWNMLTCEEQQCCQNDILIYSLNNEIDTQPLAKTNKQKTKKANKPLANLYLTFMGIIICCE